MNNYAQPIQHFYPEDVAVCYGCGRNNAAGLHIQTFMDGAEGIAHFTPRPEHSAFPGVVYGGLLASLIDCHSMGTAIATLYQREQRMPGIAPEITCVTGQLNVSYLKPTPLGVELLLRARVDSVEGRKVRVFTSVYAGDVETARGDVIAVQVAARTLKGMEGKAD
jgi:acyl-coenzyme A thioesterase PaaI-like protein